MAPPLRIRRRDIPRPIPIGPLAEPATASIAAAEGAAQISQASQRFGAQIGERDLRNQNFADRQKISAFFQETSNRIDQRVQELRSDPNQTPDTLKVESAKLRQELLKNFNEFSNSEESSKNLRFTLKEGRRKFAADVDSNLISNFDRLTNNTFASVAAERSEELITDSTTIIKATRNESALLSLYEGNPAYTPQQQQQLFREQNNRAFFTLAKTLIRNDPDVVRGLAEGGFFDGRLSPENIDRVKQAGFTRSIQMKSAPFSEAFMKDLAKITIGEVEDHPGGIGGVLSESKQRAMDLLTLLSTDKDLGTLDPATLAKYTNRTLDTLNQIVRIETQEAVVNRIDAIVGDNFQGGPLSPEFGFIDQAKRRDPEFMRIIRQGTLEEFSQLFVGSLEKYNGVLPVFKDRFSALFSNPQTVGQAALLMDDVLDYVGSFQNNPYDVARPNETRQEAQQRIARETKLNSFFNGFINSGLEREGIRTAAQMMRDGVNAAIVGEAFLNGTLNKPKSTKQQGKSATDAGFESLRDWEFHNQFFMDKNDTVIPLPPGTEEEYNRLTDAYMDVNPDESEDDIIREVRKEFQKIWGFSTVGQDRWMRNSPESRGNFAKGQVEFEFDNLIQLFNLPDDYSRFRLHHKIKPGGGEVWLVGYLEDNGSERMLQKPGEGPAKISLDYDVSPLGIMEALKTNNDAITAHERSIGDLNTKFGETKEVNGRMVTTPGTIEDQPENFRPDPVDIELLGADFIPLFDRSRPTSRGFRFVAPKSPEDIVKAREAGNKAKSNTEEQIRTLRDERRRLLELHADRMKVQFGLEPTRQKNLLGGDPLLNELGALLADEPAPPLGRELRPDEKLAQLTIQRGKTLAQAQLDRNRNQAIARGERFPEPRFDPDAGLTPFQTNVFAQLTEAPDVNVLKERVAVQDSETLEKLQSLMHQELRQVETQLNRREAPELRPDALKRRTELMTQLRAVRNELRSRGGTFTPRRIDEFTEPLSLRSIEDTSVLQNMRQIITDDLTLLEEGIGLMERTTPTGDVATLHARRRKAQRLLHSIAAELRARGVR